MAIDGAPRGRTKALQSRVEKPLLKNPLELVKEKEAQITQLRLEISALRVAISLLWKRRISRRTKRVRSSINKLAEAEPFAHCIK